MQEVAAVDDLLRRVEEIVFACIGDKELLEDPNYLDVDFFEEYCLDMGAGIEILMRIRDGLGIVIQPSQIERGEMNTIRKLWELAKRCQ